MMNLYQFVHSLIILFPSQVSNLIECEFEFLGFLVEYPSRSLLFPLLFNLIQLG